MKRAFQKAYTRTNQNKPGVHVLAGTIKKYAGNRKLRRRFGLF
jgi:hypothetical protein